VLADYVLELVGSDAPSEARIPLAFGCLAFFFIVHLFGVRWFGRIQLAMCAVLGVAIMVLVVPGLFAIEPRNYTPFFKGGSVGFLAALAPLFFAYAGFESLAQTAGEVRDSTRALPSVFLRGIAGTTVVFLLITIVAFGVLPTGRLEASPTPMAEVARQYLPFAPASLVTVGAIMAVATSLNASLLVPARLALVLAEDGLLPASLARIHSRWRTPVVGLSASFLIAALLLVSLQFSLALNIAIFALVILYALHSAALLMLPRLNPALWATVQEKAPLSAPVLRAAAMLSVAAMLGLVVIQVVQDLGTLSRTTLAERLTGHSLTSVELMLAWSLIGLLVFACRPRRRL